MSVVYGAKCIRRLRLFQAATCELIIAGLALGTFSSHYERIVLQLRDLGSLRSTLGKAPNDVNLGLSGELWNYLVTRVCTPSMRRRIPVL
jgi:hypothetical protein